MNKSELQAKLSTLEKQVANAPANARPLMQSAIENQRSDSGIRRF